MKLYARFGSCLLQRYVKGERKSIFSRGNDDCLGLLFANILHIISQKSYYWILKMRYVEIKMKKNPAEKIFLK